MGPQRTPPNLSVYKIRNEERGRTIKRSCNKHDYLPRFLPDEISFRSRVCFSRRSRYFINLHESVGKAWKSLENFSLPPPTFLHEYRTTLFFSTDEMLQFRKFGLRIKRYTQEVRAYIAACVYILPEPPKPLFTARIILRMGKLE